MVDKEKVYEDQPMEEVLTSRIFYSIALPSSLLILCISTSVAGVRLLHCLHLCFCPLCRFVAVVVQSNM